MSGWAHIRNSIFVGKWMGFYPGRGGFKMGFYGICCHFNRKLFVHKGLKIHS